MLNKKSNFNSGKTLKALFNFGQARPFYFLALLLMGLVIRTPVMARANFDTGECPKVGLALSGGGAKGLAHIGVLKVLHEAGVKIDFISGNSMGSIVGGLYAIGYDAAFLERLAKKIDWQNVLSDHVSRRGFSLEEKDEQEKYNAVFPIQNGRLKIPGGLLSGQNLSLLLCRLTWPAHNVNDFSKLPIPFVCVATDLSNGQVVDLKNGFLPDALRASMAIPTVFTPVKWKDKLLVDGLLARNFPVREVKDLGANFIIGVDVGAPLYKTKDLNNMLNIIDQTFSFRNAEDVKRQNKLCTILIKPDLKNYAPFDFQNVDSIIAIGERAARKHWAEFVKLARWQKQCQKKEPRFIPLLNIDSIYIQKVKIQGLKNTSRKLVFSRLGINAPVWVTPDQVDHAINRVYGSGFFERVTYRLHSDAQGTTLIVRVLERNKNYFKIGFHYNSNDHSALLLNITLRNLVFEGSSWYLSARLSEFPRFGTSHFFHINRRPGLASGFSAFFEKFNFTRFSADKIKAEYEYKRIPITLRFATLFSNDYALGVSVGRRYSYLTSLIYNPESDNYKDSYLADHVAAFFVADTYDRLYFTRSGIRFLASADHVFHIQRIRSQQPYGLFQRYFIFFRQYLPLPKSEHLTLIRGFLVGAVQGKRPVLPDYLFFLSNVGNPKDYVIGFPGYHFMERQALEIARAEFGFQYEPWPERFAVFKLQAARIREYWDKNIWARPLIYGLQVTAGARLPIGPVFLTVSYNSDKKQVLGYFNLGYRF